MFDVKGKLCNCSEEAAHSCYEDGGTTEGGGTITDNIRMRELASGRVRRSRTC